MVSEKFSPNVLQMPINPSSYNEIDVRKFYRSIGIDENIKLDKYDNIERVTFDDPKPESGESLCAKVDCPYWLSDVKCWKCDGNT
jgi:hypothetical protein